MMKRILCLALCLMLCVPAALAETADTLPRKFVRQLSGGNGARGYVSLTASGVAEWLNLLLPFTATEIQIRAIGEKQGDMTADIPDDDDWQIKFYAEDAQGNPAATTWLYGDPAGVYFQSELLPDTLLTLPVENVQLLYQLFRGEFGELFFRFDPMEMALPGQNGNASAYQAVAEVLGVPDAEWEAQWLPVLEKYFLHLDLWLTGYGDAGSILDEEGGLKLSASYTIPVDDLKAKAKDLIGQMLYDSELQTLLLPHVTMEQRVTYLNPQMVYFYNACIDELPLTGDVVLAREMSALGEVVSTTMKLPLPPLPETLTCPVNKLAEAVFPGNGDLFEDMTALTLIQKGNERTVELSGEKRTVSLTSADAATEENAADLTGTLRIIPNENAQETALTAAFNCSYSHRVWQDEKYLDHDTTAFSLSVTPDESLELQPVNFAFTLDYRNNPQQENSAVQVNLDVAAKLPDAEITAEAVLRITTKVEMAVLPTAGGEDVSAMTDGRKAELLSAFSANAVTAMAALNGVADPTALPTAEPAANPTAEPTEEATAVPPMTE